MRMFNVYITYLLTSFTRMFGLKFHATLFVNKCENIQNNIFPLCK